MNEISINISTFSIFILSLSAWADDLSYSASLNSNSKPLLIIVDGAGDLKGCSSAIKKSMDQFQDRLDIQIFPWSHGHYKIYRDQCDIAHSQRKGKELAELILSSHRLQPEREICLMSHSAGCSVSLSCCTWLPDKILSNHILLAPSVSDRFNIRPALNSSRRGLDVFCSFRDRWALGIGVLLVGTADANHDRRAAGRFGFQVMPRNSDDAHVFENLHQHFWSKEDLKLGNNGRHHSMFSPAFLQAKVLPLILNSEKGQ